MSTPFWQRTLKEARPLTAIRYLNPENLLGRCHYNISGYIARTPKWRQFLHLSTAVLVHNIYESQYKHRTLKRILLFCC